MKRFLFVLLSFSSLLAVSQPVVLTGKASFAPNELVRVIVYDDQFSHLEKTIASTRTDVWGVFSLEFTNQNTDFAFLAVGLKKGEFYLKPASTYVFNVLQDTSEPGSIFDEIPLQFEMTANDGGLNDAIGRFNENYNRFVYENANRIYKGRDQKLISDFGDAAMAQTSNMNGAYFSDYVEYTLASLEWVSSRLSSEAVIEKYFINKKILYNNIQYTDFFAEFFKAYLGNNSFFSYDDVNGAINHSSTYATFDKLLQQDTLLVKDGQVRELAATQILARRFNNPDISQKKVIDIFTDLGKNSDYPEIREVAQNYIKKLQYLNYGTPAPAFTLKDNEGVQVSLKQFEGKFVMLNFVKSDCQLCLSHFQTISEIVEPVQSKWQVITIVYGVDSKKVIQYAKERGYDWPFLFLDNDILLLEKYNIRTYPSYVLINPDGTIAMATAPMPDEMLDMYMNKLVLKYDKAHSAGGRK